MGTLGRLSGRSRLVAVLVATAALAGWAATNADATRSPDQPGAVETPAVEMPGAVETPGVGDQPNIVLITLDDLATADLVAMPSTRRLLARQGTTMTQGLAPTPVCGPARASLLTGQSAHNHGLLTNEGETGGFAAFDDRRTLPTWLQEAGYETMFAGKYLNGYGVRDPHYVPPGWDRWRASIGLSTYSFVNTRFNVDGTVVRPRGYSTDVLAGYTEDLLTQHRGGPQHDDPFFLWVNYVAPHAGGPSQTDDPPRVWPSSRRQLTTTAPPRRDRDAYRDARLPQDPALWERDLRGNRYAGERRGQRYRAAMREVHQQRLESLVAVDEAVERTVTALRETGELSRTVIVLTSDNGFQVGQHNLYGKLWFYDDSLRIPVILSGPGIPRGHRVATPITNPDLAVTIAALAHARPLRQVDGVDLVPWLSRPNQRRVVPIEAYPMRGGRERLYSGIRYGALTYVRGQRGHEELYDRSRDPGELTNLVRRPAYSHQLHQLRAWDRRYRNCSGTGCPQRFGRVRQDARSRVDNP